MPEPDDDIEDEGLVPEQESADAILENLDSQGQPINNTIEDNEVATVPQQPSHYVPSDLLPVFEVINNVTSAQANGRPTIVPDEAVQISPTGRQRVMMTPTLLDECDGELILTSQGSQNRPDQSATNNTNFSSEEGDVITVSAGFLTGHSSSFDLDGFNEPPIVSSQGSVGGNGSYPSLSEDAVSLPSSQGSYNCGMNPDSPAGSQPQSMSVPEQFPSRSSQSSMHEVPGHSSQEMDPLQTHARLF